MTASRALPLAVLGGLLASLLFVAGQTGSVGGVILFWMAPLPLFAVGLRLGLRPLAAAGLAGTIAVTAGQVDLGLVFAAMVAVPVLVLAGLALAVPAERSASALVIGLTGLGLAGFAVVCLLTAGQDGGLQGVMKAAVTAAVEQNAEQFRLLPPIVASILAGSGPWLAGFSAALWLLVFAGNGILAYGVVGRFGGTLAPAPAMASITVPRAVSIGFVAAVAVAQTGSGEAAFIGTNLAEILAVPLTFGGLGVVHALLVRSAMRVPMLTAFYAVIMGLGYPIVLVVALGVIEQWVGLRQRFAGRPRRGDE